MSCAASCVISCTSTLISCFISATSCGSGTLAVSLDAGTLRCAGPEASEGAFDEVGVATVAIGFLARGADIPVCHVTHLLLFGHGKLAATLTTHTIAKLLR